MCSDCKLKNNYSIHGILKAKSNFSGYLPNYFLCEEKFDDSSADIIFKMQDKIKIENYKKIAPGLFYSHNEKSIISQFRMFGFKFTWKLDNLSGNHTIASFSRVYRNLVKMPVSTVFPLNDYIKFILQIKLLLKGFCLSIGGCFLPNNKDEAVIISSFGGVGKSTTTLNLFNKTGEEYLSDDTLILSKDKAYSYPTKIRVRKFGCCLLHYIKDIPAEKYISEGSIAQNPVSVNKIFFLELGKNNDVTKISPVSAAKKALAINRKIIPYFMERSIIAYSYFDDSFDLDKLLNLESDLINKFFSNLQCFVIEAKSQKNFNDLIFEAIS